jgi:hypothetical protein
MEIMLLFNTELLISIHSNEEKSDAVVKRVCTFIIFMPMMPFENILQLLDPIFTSTTTKFSMYPGFEPGPPRSEVRHANHCVIRVEMCF